MAWSCGPATATRRVRRARARLLDTAAGGVGARHGWARARLRGCACPDVRFGRDCGLWLAFMILRLVVKGGGMAKGGVRVRACVSVHVHTLLLSAPAAAAAAAAPAPAAPTLAVVVATMPGIIAS